MSRGWSAALKCTVATVTKQNHYVSKKKQQQPEILAHTVMYSMCAYTQGHTGDKHMCTYEHFSKRSSPFQHHTLIAVILSSCCLILEERNASWAPRWKRTPHLSQQYLSTGNKFRFHYTLCKRQSSALNEMCMTPRWLSDPLDWEMGKPEITQIKRHILGTSFMR